MRNATRKMAIKVRLSKLGEARDEDLMKTLERVDAESKKFALEWVVVDFWKKMIMRDAERTKEAGDIALAVLSHQHLFSRDM